MILHFKGFPICQRSPIHYYEGEDLRGAVFSKMHLQGARFKHCNLRGANFKGADLSGAHFLHCCLQYGEFHGAHLDTTVFRGNDTYGAIFADTSLDPRLPLCNKELGHFSQSTVPGLSEAYCISAPDLKPDIHGWDLEFDIGTPDLLRWRVVDVFSKSTEAGMGIYLYSSILHATQEANVHSLPGTYGLIKALFDPAQVHRSIGGWRVPRVAAIEKVVVPMSRMFVAVPEIEVVN